MHSLLYLRSGCAGERIFIELVMSDRTLEASREGSKWRIYGTYKNSRVLTLSHFVWVCHGEHVHVLGFDHRCFGVESSRVLVQGPCKGSSSGFVLVEGSRVRVEVSRVPVSGYLGRVRLG